MAEELISNFDFIVDNLHSLGCDCGGAYRVVNVTIHIDKTTPIHFQRVALAHEVLGAYLGSIVPPADITEIAENLIGGLDILEAPPV